MVRKPVQKQPKRTSQCDIKQVLKTIGYGEVKYHSIGVRGVEHHSLIFCNCIPRCHCFPDDDVPLGPSPAPAGSGRLDQPCHGGLLRGIRICALLEFWRQGELSPQRPLLASFLLTVVSFFKACSVSPHVLQFILFLV